MVVDCVIVAVAFWKLVEVTVAVVFCVLVFRIVLRTDFVDVTVLAGPATDFVEIMVLVVGAAIDFVSVEVCCLVTVSVLEIVTVRVLSLVEIWVIVAVLNTVLVVGLVETTVTVFVDELARLPSTAGSLLSRAWEGFDHGEAIAWAMRRNDRMRATNFCIVRCLAAQIGADGAQVEIETNEWYQEKEKVKGAMRLPGDL